MHYFFIEGFNLLGYIAVYSVEDHRVGFRRTTRHYGPIPEDRTLQNHHCDNSNPATPSFLNIFVLQYASAMLTYLIVLLQLKL
jgi:hypothetical protein